MTGLRNTNILDAISDMVFVHDLDSGAILDVNQRACEAYGYSPEEFQHLSIEQLSAGVPPYSQAEAIKLIDAAAKGQSQRAEWLARRRDGSTFWVEVSMRKVEIEGLARMLVTVHDIDDRKRLEQELRTSESRYREIFEQSPVSLWLEDWTDVITAVRALDVAETDDFPDYLRNNPSLVDECLEKVRILDVNPATLTMFEADSKAQMLESLGTVFATSDTRPGFEGELVALGKKMQVYRTEMALNTVNGNVIHVLLTMTFPAPDDASGSVLVSLMDISARVEAEAELRQERARLAELLESRSEELQAESARLQTAEALARVGSWQVSLNRGETIWSQQIYEILGLDSDRVLPSQETYLAAVPESERNGVRDFFARAARATEPCEYSHRIIRPRGGQRYVHAYGRALQDSDGKAIVIVGALQDVTEMQLAQARLEQSEEKFRGLFESIADGIAYTTLDGYITDFNPAFQAMLGYEPDEIRALTYSDFTPERWHEMEAAIIEEQVFGRGYSDEYEKEYRRKDGSIFPIRLRAWLVRDDTGEPTGLWGLVRDITVEKRAEAERERYTRALQAAVNDLEGFSYSVSHDLRAPLRSIDSYANLLIEDYGDQLNADAQTMLQTVRRNAQKLSELINDLLSFSRASRRELNLQSVDMTALFQSVFEELAPVDEGRTIECTIDPLPKIWADPAAVRQVVTNLLGNAIKFSAKRDAPRIHVIGESDDDWCRYSVHDNGAGFEPEYVDTLFTVFSRLHSEAEFHGSGIGLAIVKRIVEKHGGEVWAEGAPDHGACFGFSLPRQPLQTQPKETLDELTQ